MDIPNLRDICRSIPLPNFPATLSSFRVVVIFSLTIREKSCGLSFIMELG
jgi:hypothetical protein